MQPVLSDRPNYGLEDPRAVAGSMPTPQAVNPPIGEATHAWGLHDMNGNGNGSLTGELNLYRDTTDPTGPANWAHGVVRG